MKSLLSLPLLLLLPVGEAAAADEGSLGFSMSGGALFTDPLEVVDSTWMIVPRLDYWVNPTLMLELEVGYAQGQTRDGVPETFGTTSVIPRVGFTGRVFPDEPVNLLLNMGVGAWAKSVRDDGALDLPTSGMDVDFVGGAGPGLLVPLGTSGLALRSDVNFLLNLGSENFRNRGDAFLNWAWTGGLSFGVPVKPDEDKDGIVDADDRCPAEAEDLDGFEDTDGCPDLDNDQDGVADADDQCADEKEDLDEFEDDDGCPDLDNDEDGIADADDQCPVEAGPEATIGCPDADEDGVADAVDECEEDAGTKNAFGCPDADEDRVPDHRDECPEEAADGRINPLRSNGCPGRVFISDQALVITEKIQFATGKATIKSESEPLLTDIAAALKKYKGLKKLQIEGHTDAQGDDEKNQTLSEERAAAVKAWLVENGEINAARLEAVGFGETKPIGDNETDEGRTANRRVEFKILEQDVAQGFKRKMKGKAPKKAEAGGEGEAPEGEAAEQTPAAAKTVSKPAEKEEAAEEKATEEAPAEEKAAEEKPAEEAPKTVSKPKAEEPAEEKPAEEAPKTVSKPKAEEPAEEKAEEPADDKAGEGEKKE